MNKLNLIISDSYEAIQFYLHSVLSKIEYLPDNKITYDMDEVHLMDILDEASMISLIKSTKILIGLNFDIGKVTDIEYDYLSKYVANNDLDVYIYLVTKKIDARSKKYQLFKDNFEIIDLTKGTSPDDIRTYIKKSISTRGYKISDIDLTYLSEKLGNNIVNIDLELDKICLYKDKDKLITTEDIDLLIADSIDDVIYEFTNAVLEDDTLTTVKMYNDFKIQNMPFDYLLATLINTFHQALIIKLMNNGGKSNSEIAKKIGKKEFYVKKTLDRLYRYTQDDLAKYIDKLYKIDLDFKTGKSNYDMLEFFLINKEKAQG